MTGPERLDLTQPREIGDLLRDSYALYRRHMGTVVAIAAAVVIPVQLIVAGIGLEELTGGYRDSMDTADALVSTVVSFLVIGPLVTAAAIKVVQDLAAGESPHAGQAIQSGLDVFVPVFLAVLLAGAGVALGFTLLILPGIFLAVRLFLVPQAVVIEKARGIQALNASWTMTQGFWWKIFGTGILVNLAAIGVGFLVLLPFDAIAESADRQAIYLAGAIIAETLTAPFIALVSTLLYFDIKARRGSAPSPPSDTL